ncbi:opsin-3 [Hydra vulgaris]|uniref:Opsin n=1 Tax=Hydra vulgaris TaxID=6087 RepID=A0A857GWV7_HYDVU|nr:opsin-3-like [Hydra vulgaris]QHF16603.1 opsin [Hydra vulgaris]
MNIEKIVSKVYLSAVLVTSLALNITAFYITLLKVKKKELTHFFIVSISITNLLESTVGIIPQLVISNDSLLERTPLCISSGFAVLGFAITNITHLAVLSFIRTVAIKYPMLYLKYHKMIWCRVTLILVCYAYGFVWATLPLIGWSKYDLDLDKKRCSLDWKLTKSNSFSYILAIYICCNILPGIVVALTLYFSKKTIYRRQSCKLRKNFKKGRLEREYLKICYLSAIAYFFFWTTYAVIGALTLLQIQISPILATFTALITKLSTISNVVVNCFVLKSFRNHFINLKFIRIIKKYLEVLKVKKHSKLDHTV